MTKVWSAKWICDPRFVNLEPIPIFHKELDKSNRTEAHRDDLVNQHVLFHKTFWLPEEIGDKLRLDISGDDYYKLYINGQFVGQGPAQSYPYHYYYNRYDVSAVLNKGGGNAIAVHVYYNGKINRAFSSGEHRQGMIAELLIGDKIYVQSDSTWKCKPTMEYGDGETVGYQTQFLENIDARLSEPWREPGFDDSAWQTAAEKTNDDHVLILQETPPVTVYRLQPKNIHRLEDGHFVVDFGQEITGQFIMEAQGIPGQSIEIRCGEELEADAIHVRYNMRCNCTYQEFWTLSGNRDVLEFYDYKAFRYVEVIGKNIEIEPNTFAAVVRHYPFDDQSCTFQSSHDLLDQIWTICKNGVKYGSQEQFMDCPTREKGQYLGDNTIITHSHMYLSGDLRLTRKALRDFALTAEMVCPGLLAVAPGSFMQEIADFSLQWPLQLLQYYKQSGDIAFLQEMLPAAEGIAEYFKKYEREDGLIQNVKEKWNLVDWPNNLRDGYDFNLSIPVSDGCHNVINAFYIGALDSINEIRTYLGFTVSLDKEQDRRKEAYRKSFYDDRARLFIDAEGSSHSSLHANALPFYFGLVPEESKKAVIAFLKKKRLSCGVYMSYFLLNGLALAGEYEFVFDLLTCEDEHSWANMVREGATTCFEAWGKDQKWNTSLCHPWASSPIPVLIEHIIGLKPLRPGWEEIGFDPHIQDKVDDFTFSMKVKTGTIKISYKNGQLSIEAPNGVAVQRKQEI